jgi:hypothetical protein
MRLLHTQTDKIRYFVIYVTGYMKIAYLSVFSPDPRWTRSWQEVGSNPDDVSGSD